MSFSSQNKLFFSSIKKNDISVFGIAANKYKKDNLRYKKAFIILLAIIQYEFHASTQKHI